MWSQKQRLTEVKYQLWDKLLVSTVASQREVLGFGTKGFQSEASLLHVCMGLHQVSGSLPHSKDIHLR